MFHRQEILKLSMNILKIIIAPEIFIIILFSTGILCVHILERKQIATIILSFSLFCLCLFSSGPFSNYLVWNLERKYSPITDFNSFLHIEKIILLTGWDSNNPEVPYTSNIGYRSALRTMEAHRLFKNLSEPQIIISGRAESTQVMQKLLFLLGVPTGKITLDNGAASTWDNAINSQKILQKQPFFLVTSAIHMPRAMWCFRSLGMDPIPAPADFLYGFHAKFSLPNNKPLDYYLPHINTFLNTSLAFHEYIGLYWYKIKLMIHL